jgi:hypothetical protein
VGCPKTGTSYLKSVLWASRDDLAAQGLELPFQAQSDHFHLTLALRGMLDEAIDPPSAFTTLERLPAAMAQTHSPRVLILHESLAPATVGQVRRLVDLLDGFEVQVVITARDLARQIPSGWQQRIQQREQITYADFLAAVVERTPAAADFWANQDLLAITSRWGEAVPAERMHVVTVPPPGTSPQLLLARVCSVLGVDPDKLSAEAPRGNPSLGAVQAELLRRVNVALGDRLPHPRAGYGRLGKRYLAGRVLSQQGGTPPTLPPELYEWCERLSADVITELGQRGYDVVGDLGELMPAARDTTEPEPELSEAAVADAATRAMADMLDQRHRDLARIDALKERPQRWGTGREAT